MPLLTLTDFETGRIKIATDQNTKDDFAVYYADANLKQYLYPMLGKELADEYIATPAASKFNDVNGFLLVRGFKSDGMKECLKNFVAAEYGANQPHVNGLNGFGKIKIEGVTATITHSILYNRGVQMAKAIQQYAMDEFANFKGVELKYSGF